MKKNFYKICSTMITIILIISSVKIIGDLLEDKTSDKRYASFFTEKKDVDVIFIGSSHVRHGIFPMELWGEYGITSYNLAANGSTIPVSYWTLVNALDYQNPRVVVMDVYDIWPGRVCSDSWGQVESQFDAFPFSINKVKMVIDLFNDKELTDGSGNNLYERRWDLLFNLNSYHTRWNSLNEEDFILKEENDTNSRIWKGAEPLTGIATRAERDYGSLDPSTVEYDELSKDYLIKIIELCKNENINLVLINTAYDSDDTSKVFQDSVAEISKIYNVPYIDFTSESIINFETDLWNTGNNTHVNFSGAERFTDFIGRYIYINYNLTDHRQDINYNQWSYDYSRFIESKNSYLIQQSDIAPYMSFLNNPDYVVLVHIINESILNDSMVDAFIRNLGVSLNENANLYIVNTENYNVQYINTREDYINEWETQIGTLALIRKENKNAMHINDSELYTYDSTENSTKIIICVYSKEKECIIDTRGF